MTKKLVIYLITLTVLSTISAIYFFNRVQGQLEADDLILVGLLYMPIPAISAILTEKVFTKGSLKDLGFKWKEISYKRLFITAILYSFVLYIGYLGVSLLLGNVFGIEIFGNVISDAQALKENFLTQYSYLPAEDVNIPNIYLLLLLTPLIALQTGFTINLIFALGEELGWRGIMYRELSKASGIKRDIFIGIVWGVWHTPILALGYNYPDQPLYLAVIAMVLVTIPLSFILSSVTKMGKSVLGASALHGIYNAFVPIFTLIIVGGSNLFSLPMGILNAFVLLIVVLLIPKIETLVEKIIEFLERTFGSSRVS